MLDSVIFWAFATVSIVAALGAVLNRSSIYAALCLITVFMSIAGFYVLNNADFLAIAQIIIYAVGLTIIMLFAIMFTGDKPFEAQKVSRTAKMAYSIVIAYVFALLLRAAFLGLSPSVGNPITPEKIEQLAMYGSSAMLGTLLFNKYALPFEVASILLLAAMIGAIVIAKKRFVNSDVDLGDMRLSIDESSAPSEAALAALRQQRLLEEVSRKEALEADTEAYQASGKADTHQ